MGLTGTSGTPEEAPAAKRDERAMAQTRPILVREKDTPARCERCGGELRPEDSAAADNLPLSESGRLVHRDRRGCSQESDRRRLERLEAMLGMEPGELAGLADGDRAQPGWQARRRSANAIRSKDRHGRRGSGLKEETRDAMTEHFEKVKGYLLDLGMTITKEIEAEELVVVDDEEKAIKTLFVDCEAPVVILEQLIGEIPKNPGDLFIRLLQMNNTLAHGAFVLDESASRIFYRDTLELTNLDPNELEASINALSLAMAEHGAELLGYLRK